MTRPRMLGLWFAGAFVIALGWLALLKVFASWDYADDRVAWGRILLRSAYYGVLGVVVGLGLTSLSRRRWRGWLLLGLAALLLELDLIQLRGIWLTSHADEAVTELRDFLSQSSPVAPPDTTSAPSLRSAPPAAESSAADRRPAPTNPAH